MGIHGEPGVETLQFRTGRELVSLMADKLMSTTDKHSPRALLVNNLGGFSALEMSLLTREMPSARIPAAWNFLTIAALATLYPILCSCGWYVKNRANTETNPLSQQALCL
ncbi:dihydroxyacetone kinase subunit DhaK [Enterobacter asburiae]|nr:dihydroxyacetone kinase subunit DhaK [Enterobacter asburiae]